MVVGLGLDIGFLAQSHRQRRPGQGRHETRAKTALAAEEIVALPVHLPAPPVAALLGRHVDDAGHRLAVLGVEAAGEHLDLVDDRRVDRIAVAAAGQRIVYRDAVDDELGIVGASAANVNLVVLQRNAGLVGDHLHQVVQGHGFHLLGRHAVGATGQFDLDEPAFRGDQDGIGVDGFHVEQELDLRHLPRSHGDRLRAQTVGDVRRPHRVGAGAQATQPELAVLQGDGTDAATGDVNVGVGQDLAALCVHDPTLDHGGRQRRRLRLGRRRRVGLLADGRGHNDRDHDQHRQEERQRSDSVRSHGSSTPNSPSSIPRTAPNPSVKFTASNCSSTVTTLASRLVSV